ncbi:hypothetical protein B0H13DRAFT_2317581 [Mycena leptocephala]|nr:hypothetical protein B0H13DRAFT_2317581 [Mycena leptocephala]
MFSGTGFQIHGGTFYNVDGDVNLQTHHHLRIEDQHADFHPLAGSALGIDDGRGKSPPIQDQESHAASFQPQAPAGTTLGPEDSEREGAGAARNPRHGMAARPMPYDIASRPRHSRISDDLGPLSSRTGAFTPSSGGLPPTASAGGTFIAADNVHHHYGEGGINILHRAVALEALYDSADSFPQPRQLRPANALAAWARWGGKIRHHAVSVPEIAGCRLPWRRVLFKRGHTTRGNTKVLFATLAYQLALNNRNFNPSILRIVEYDPSIVGRDIYVQLHKLLVESCSSLRDSAPPIFLIDGLDECDTHRAQVEILRLIGSAVAQHPNIFRFLIASRPEAHIRDILAEPSFHRLLDSVNIRQSFLDIETYFCDEFSRIHREHRETMSRVTTPWPPPEILNDLVEKSSGYFIYAATVIKFVDDKFSRPTERLAAVQNLTPTDSDAPFATLDQLYIQILSGVPTRFRSQLGDILHCTELHVQLKLHQIERLLELQPGDVRLILRSLHSVLKIDSDNISAHHASFLDFLRDQQRSTIFHIDLENRMNVACAVLKIFSEDSHRLDTPDDPLVWRFDTKQFISFIISSGGTISNLE